MFRRQILLAEKRSFSWQLNRGWNFISSPLRGEELTVGTPCHVMYWNGMRYTDTTDLQVSDFQPCNAFWVYSSMKQTLSLDGRMGLSGPTLRKGWNTIGGLYCKALDESVFTTDGNYNVITNIMQPGLGYWIFVK